MTLDIRDTVLTLSVHRYVHLLHFGPCRGYLISTAYWQFLVFTQKFLLCFSMKYRIFSEIDTDVTVSNSAIMTLGFSLFKIAFFF